MLVWAQRHFVELFVANILYNTFVQAMKAPDEKCSDTYVYWYKVTHALALNWRVALKRFPACK
jgi:hypothetical protein